MLTPMALFLRLLASAKRSNPFSLQKSTNLTRMPNHKWNIAQEDNLSYSASLAQSKLMTHNTAYMDDVHIKHARKLKEAKHVLMSKVTEEGREVFRMIDAIQRLGIEYLFEEEIEEALRKKSFMVSKLYCSSDRELFDVALQFRLLRQQGYFVHEDVFNTFMDKEGNLGENIRANIMGLLELHEASQLSVEDENNLDEAGEKSRNLLAAWLLSGNHDPRLAKHISGPLQLPFHKSLPRFSHRRFCSNDFQFQVNKSWIHALQELANYDSCIVTSVHREEFVQVCKWWKDLGLNKELKLARDEPHKWYMWPTACLTDPKFSEQRMELIKPLSLVYIIDDIFDVYGSPDELALFTDVVNRWDLEAAEKLPQHLRICFNALHGITNEFAQKVYLKHGCYPLNTLRKLWVQLCNAFLVEAKWFASGHVPSTEEYLKNGMISSGVHVVLGHTWFLLNHDITTQTGGTMNDIHGLVSSVASILRLSDDLQGYMEDDQNGHDGSYVECYMKQHRGISAEETRQHVSHMISGSWKSLNQECLEPFRFSSTFKKACLNTARMVRLMYNSDGNHCFLDRENLMSYLL